MSESKGWEEQMKTSEPFRGKTFTREKIGRIEQVATSPIRNQGVWSRRLTQVTATVCLAGLLGAGVYYSVGQESNGSKQVLPLPSNEWTLTEPQVQLYEAYMEVKSDALLQNMEPIQIFRWYVRASKQKDYETQYALYNHDNGYELPTREEFLKDVASDPEGSQRSVQKWTDLENKYTLEQRMDGDQSLIVMTPIGENSSSGKDVMGVRENQLIFGLRLNAAGVWKVNWMPMQ